VGLFEGALFPVWVEVLIPFSGAAGGHSCSNHTLRMSRGQRIFPSRNLDRSPP
jgi:hypothetical protein